MSINKIEKKIFISWSGEKSKRIAVELKSTLEDEIYKGTNLECFVSDLDIASGTDWWDKIKNELKTCKQGILCITKENIRAPWIFFEAGAMVAHDVPTIPLLINCEFMSLKDSPLDKKHSVKFNDPQKFIQMITDLNKQLGLLPLDKSQISPIAKLGYEKLTNRLKCTLNELENMRVFSTKYTHPNNITTVNYNTIYISAPMASIDNDEYVKLRTYLLSLNDILRNIGFKDVICPHYSIENSGVFDGGTKAVKDNFPSMKQVDSMIIIYPNKIPSSVLVEIGYGIALCKRLVIFYKEGLPYMLEEIGGTIQNIKTFKFEKFSDITKKIQTNGMHLFENVMDEND